VPRVGNAPRWLLRMSQMKMPHRAGLATVVGLVGLAAVIAFAAWIMRPQSPTHVADNAAGSDKTWQAVAPGRVEPSSGETKITPVAVALVDEVLVKPSEKVFAGEPLIRLKDDELRARLAAAEAQVALRERARNDQRASGRAAERRRAEDALSEAESAVFDARSALDTAAVARRVGGGTDARLSAARSALSRAQEQLRTRAAALRAVETDSPLPSQSEAQLSIARAERSVARAALDKMTIRAPIAGTVLQVNVKVGETAMPSSAQPLLVIGDVSALRVRAELDDRDVGNVKIGQPVIVRATAFPDREISGKVASIAPIVVPASGVARGPRNATDVDVVEVLIDLANPGPLASGMQVDAYFGRSE
jgi:HlyD family secretion protein